MFQLGNGGIVHGEYGTTACIEGGAVSHLDRTYVIFDGDNDMWAYAFMKGWKANDRIDFDFGDAHDLRTLSSQAPERTVKTALRGRMASSRQAVVLVGEATKNLYRFVRWEIELAMDMDLPIVVANLNGLRIRDEDRCPPIVREHCAMHVAFKMRIIMHALDGFSPWYRGGGAQREPGWRYFTDEDYRSVGL
jgi:hypothetical protein